MTEMDTQPRMRWWGWGEDGHDGPVKPGAKVILSKHCGWPAGVDRPHVALEEVSLPQSRLTGELRARLAETVGENFVRDDHAVRVSHAAGRSLPDLIRLRTGQLSSAPDAVVSPAASADVDALLAVCAGESAAVVPVAGGTSAAGATAAARHGPCSVLD